MSTRRFVTTNNIYVDLRLYIFDRVDWGEHPDEALVREVYEETGLEVTCDGSRFLTSRPLR